MTETIGKVTLNLDKYPGEDYYCDGSVEDEILEIVKKYSTVEYDRIIAEKKEWPVLYHLSALRENIVDFLPMKKTDKVLEVGSGCGAITGALSKKAGRVTCVDLSKVPGLRRSKYFCISSSERDSPAGQPSTTTPNAFPWDSPHVVILKMFPNVEPAMIVLLFNSFEPIPYIRKNER